MKKNRLVMSLIIIAIMITAVISLFISFNISGNNNIEKYKADMKKAGRMTSLEDVEKKYDVTSEIPDSLIRKENDYKSSRDEKTPKQISSEIIQKAYTNWDDLTADEKNAAVEEMNKRKDAYNEILALADKPGSNLLGNIDESIWTNSIDRIEIRNLGRAMIALNGKMMLEDGKTSEALTIAKNGMKYCDLNFRTPTIISVLIADGLAHMTFSLIQEAVSGKKISRETCQGIMDSIISSEKLFQYHIDAIELEKVYTAELLDRFINGKLPDEYERMIFHGWVPSDNEVLKNVMKAFWAPMIKSDIMLMNKMYDDNISAFKARNYQKAMDAFDKYHKKIEDMSKIHVFARTFMPGMHGIYKYMLKSMTKSDITKLALACKMYKEDNGHYPDLLDELAPQYLPDIPQDPYTNSGYTYRKIDTGGFIIYTRMENEKSRADDVTTSSLALSKLRFSFPFPGNQDEYKVTIKEILWYEKE